MVKKKIYFNDPEVNAAYQRLLNSRDRATAFRGMSTMEILKEIRK